MQIPLGLILKNENIASDMVEVMKDAQKYVPDRHKCFFGGDLLTSERGRNVQLSMQAHASPRDQLQLLICKSEDWHAEVAFLTVVFKVLFNENSSQEKGTLYQLQKMINRTYVSQKVSKHVTAVKEFLSLVCDAYISCCPLNLFGMERPDEEYAVQSDSLRADLRHVAETIVDEHILIEAPSGRDQDYAFNYSVALMKLGLLHRDFADAIKEGDGQRVCMLWKFLTLHFYAYRHHKYALEGLILTVRLGFTLSSRKAEQLKWNRFINTKGGAGNCIPLDLHLEHINNATKRSLKRLGANLTERAAVRSSQASGALQALKKNLQTASGVKASYGRHAEVKAKKDFETVLQTLIDSNVTSVLPGREHKSFPAFSADVLHKVDLPKMFKWIKDHKRKIKGGRADYVV